MLPPPISSLKSNISDMPFRTHSVVRKFQISETSYLIISFISWSAENCSLTHYCPCSLLKWELFSKRFMLLELALTTASTTPHKLLLSRSLTANIFPKSVIRSGFFLFSWPLNVAVPKVSPQIFSLSLITTLVVLPRATT